MKSDMLIPMAHKLYYVPTVLGLCGWVRHYDNTKFTERLEAAKASFLSIQKLRLNKGGQHWGWVLGSELQEFTHDASVREMLIRFLAFADKIEDLTMQVAAPQVSDEIIGIKTGHSFGKPTQWFMDKRIPFDPDACITYVPAGFAMKVLHAVKTAQTQGVSPRDVLLFRQLEPPTADGYRGMETVVQNARGQDLVTQPLFSYLQYH